MKIIIENNQSILATIRKRKSIRTYAQKPITDGDRKILQHVMRELENERFRFEWFERETGNHFTERIGTYGVIKGAQAFLIGILHKNSEDQKDTAIQFGYAFEQIILKATELGLGTCWLGGTFIAAVFEKDINIEQNEKIMMLSPVGIPAEKKHLISKLTSLTANSSTRKLWQDLFFDKETKSYLSIESAGKYAPALEMVRLAPSAVNSQPWRIMKSESAFHFYVAPTHYYAVGKESFLHYNDIGIAMLHFELTCRALGLAGTWVLEKRLNSENLEMEYIRSWKIKE